MLMALNFSGVELLPNQGQFSDLNQALNRVDTNLAMASTISAEAFNLAIQRAAVKDKASFDKYFGKGAGEAAKLTSKMNVPAVSAMFNWLMAAQAHAARVGTQHLSRDSIAQEKYMEGKKTAEQSFAPGTAPSETFLSLPSLPQETSSKAVLIGAAVIGLVVLVLYLRSR